MCRFTPVIQKILLSVIRREIFILNEAGNQLAHDVQLSSTQVFDVSRRDIPNLSCDQKRHEISTLKLRADDGSLASTVRQPHTLGSGDNACWLHLQFR